MRKLYEVIDQMLEVIPIEEPKEMGFFEKLITDPPFRDQLTNVRWYSRGAAPEAQAALWERARLIINNYTSFGQGIQPSEWEDWEHQLFIIWANGDIEDDLGEFGAECEYDPEDEE